MKKSPISPEILNPTIEVILAFLRFLKLTNMVLVFCFSKNPPKSARSSANEKRCLNLVKNAHFPSYFQIKMKILPVGSA